jgi:hypothetical protein
METGTIFEFEEKYPDEWILVDILDLDDENEPKTGTLLAHSPSRDALYEYATKIDLKFPLVEWTGRCPKKGYISIL